VLERLVVPVRVLVLGIALVILAHIGLQTASTVTDASLPLRMFDVAREHNVPTGWSVLLLLQVSVVAVVRALEVTGRQRWAWVAAAVVGAYLAADEWFRLHEHLRAVGHRITASGVTYAWVLPGLVLGALGAFAVWTWSRSMPARARQFQRAGVAVFGLGALGVEALSGWLEAERTRWLWVSLTTVEEGLEMCGVGLFVAALHASRSVAAPSEI